MNVVETSGKIVHLCDRIPTFVPQFPLILIGNSETASAQRFYADWCIWAKNDRDRMGVMPRAWRVHGFDSKIASPSRQLEYAFVGHSLSHVFQFRGQRDHVTGM